MQGDVQLLALVQQTPRLQSLQPLPQLPLQQLVYLVGLALQQLILQMTEHRDDQRRQEIKSRLTEHIPDSQQHRFGHVLREQAHYPLHHEVVQFEAIVLQMSMQFGQHLDELLFQFLDEPCIELNIELDVPALEEKIPQQPVGSRLVERLQQSGTDGHDALKVPHLEGDGCDHSVQFQFRLNQVHLALAVEVSTRPIHILTVLVVLGFTVLLLLLEVRGSLDVRLQYGHRETPVIRVLQEVEGSECFQSLTALAQNQQVFMLQELNCLAQDSMVDEESTPAGGGRWRDRSSARGSRWQGEAVRRWLVCERHERKKDSVGVCMGCDGDELLFLWAFFPIFGDSGRVVLLGGEFREVDVGLGVAKHANG